VLIWDSASNPPFFRDGDFVIVAAEACRAAIEVKGRLSHEDLKDALAKSDSSFEVSAPHSRPSRGLYKALFAFDVDSQVKFPVTIFNSIANHYKQNSVRPFAERIGWSQKYSDRWASPWINDIIVLRQGVVHLQPMQLNHKDVIPSYVSFPSMPDDDDTYGFMERTLLLHLLGSAGGFGGLAYTHPGIASVHQAIHPDLNDISKAMFLRDTIDEITDEITKVGFLPDEEVKKLVSKEHKPLLHKAKP
jgi:hypothetical protein